MFLIIILYMLFASTFTIGKAALSYTTPIFLIALRMLCAGILLLGYQYYYNYRSWRFNRKDWYDLFRISLFEYYGAFVLEFIALGWLTSAKACLIYNISPFVTALLAFWILGDRMSLKQILGLIIGFLGFIPILWVTTPSEQVISASTFISLPELIQLGSVVCASYGWILLKQVQRKGYTTVMINSITMTGAGIMALITSLVVEGQPILTPPGNCASNVLPGLCHFFSLYTANGQYLVSILLFAGYTLALVVIANIIGFNLYGYLLSKYSTTFLSFTGSITPFFAALFGWIFLGEHIGAEFYATAAIVFLGLILFYQDELLKKLPQ